jgi:membrane-associated phospholipid phosphatase
MISPTSSRNRLLFLAGTAGVLCLVAIGTIDVPASVICLRKDLPGDVEKGLNLTEVFAHGVGVAFICLAFVVLDKRKWLLPRLICLPAVCGIAANLVKLGIARGRPYSYTAETLPSALETFGSIPGSLHDHSLQSFPSGHTATAVGLAIALCRLYPSASPLFICFAILAACQRIAVGAHFVSDTLAGAAVALLISAFCADRLFWDAEWGRQR